MLLILWRRHYTSKIDRSTNSNLEVASWRLPSLALRDMKLRPLCGRCRGKSRYRESRTHQTRFYESRPSHRWTDGGLDSAWTRNVSPLGISPADRQQAWRDAGSSPTAAITSKRLMRAHLAGSRSRGRTI